MVLDLPELLRLCLPRCIKLYSDSSFIRDAAANLKIWEDHK